MRILANDGLDQIAIEKLIASGHEVSTTKVAQDDLKSALTEFDGIIVRSATKVRAADVDGNTRLRIVGRAGVGMDNIEIPAMQERNIKVVNTPGASSTSVAELVFAYLFAIARHLPEASRQMPENGSVQFADLKKKFSKAFELKGKTLGLVGYGRIAQEVARIALGIGMEVIAFDIFFANDAFNASSLQHAGGLVKQGSLEDVQTQADFLSFHIPFKAGQPALANEAFLAGMKPGAIVVNCARGGIIDEQALLVQLDSGHIAAAGLDVFDNEPTPLPQLLAHPRVVSTPHIGGSTNEAQERIGLEIADQFIDFFHAA